MNVLDLFSGIGGFSLGLERAGFRTVAFCERESFCRHVLAKHWPDVPCYDDVQTLSAERLKADGVGSVDLICGGFPCQDISTAGLGKGLAGERSGLWFQFHRLIQEIQPRWVIAENVSALRSRGLDQVLRSLAEIGYDAEWHCIPASAVGAPHQRDRIWIVAYPNGLGEHQPALPGHIGGLLLGGGSNYLSDSDRIDAQRLLTRCNDKNQWQKPIERQAGLLCRARLDQEWSVEPDMGRVAHGVPRRVDRIKSLGNAVVPKLPELLGRAIMESSIV